MGRNTKNVWKSEVYSTEIWIEMKSWTDQKDPKKAVGQQSLQQRKYLNNTTKAHM